jgi:hypothetical protein
VSVPFPTDDEADRSRPDQDEAWLSARAFATACAPEGGLTQLQQFVIRGLTQALTADLIELGDLNLLEPITPEEYAQANARRDRLYRIRRVQTMVLLELLLRPLPDDVTARVEAFAEALGLGADCRDMLEATRHLSAGSTELALADFMRNGYEVLHFERSGEALPDDPSQYWVPVDDDPELAARWAGLEECPAGSLGRSVWEFYKARGFNVPGTPISVPPRLAQHDFVHVLADYGTTVQAEIEVFALIARADEDPRSFSLLVAVLALFEGGYLERGFNAFRADPDHLSDEPSNMGVRLGNAIARGGEVAWRFRETNGIDLLGVDWFARADGDLEALRDEFGFTGPGAKSLEAKVAGSAGPTEPGGVTPAQLGWGRDMAEAEGRPYDPFGASLNVDQLARLAAEEA